MTAARSPATRHVYRDPQDLRDGLADYVLAHPARRMALRRASAETIAAWLMISRSTLFDTLARFGLTLGDLQRGRI